MQANSPPRRKQQTRNKSDSSGFPSTRGEAGRPAPGSPGLEDGLPPDLLRNVPPHSIEAEQAVLGGVFLKPESLYALIDILN